MRNLSCRVPLLFFCLCILLCACSRSTPTYYYVLESSESDSASGPLPATSLRVAPVTVPHYLDRNSLIRNGGSPASLDLSDSHQWAEPPADGIRRVIQAEIAGPLRKRQIHVQANADDSESDYTLFVHVENFASQNPGTVRLTATWRCEKGRKVIAQGLFNASEVLADETVPALVRAQSSLVRQMASWMLDQMPDLAPRSGR